MYDVHDNLYSVIKRKKMISPTAVISKKDSQKQISFVSFYDELIILIRMLQLVGLFPIGRDKNGRLNCYIRSPVVIHCILVFLAATCVTCLNIYEIVRKILSLKTSFDEQILFAILLFDIVIYLIPVFTFLERWKILKYFENWNAFKIEFYEITGRPLMFNTKRYQKVFLLYWVLMVSAQTSFVYRSVSQRFERMKMSREWHFASLIATAYYGTLIVAIIFLWYFNIKAICEGAKALLKYFKECKKNGECSVIEMNQLWLRLQDLCCELGDAFSYTILFFLFFMFVVIMLEGYSAMALFGTDQNTIVGYLRFGLFGLGFFLMSIIPDLAHVATKNVVDDIINFTLRWAALERNPLLAKDLRWMVENVSIKRPAISLAGYVNLHRSVNVSMYAAMVTYFVVVFQFKMSKTEEK